MEKISDRVIERLGLYRRLLTYELIHNRQNIYSHELADLANLTSAQVRRDLMVLNYSGSSRKGYRVSNLIEQISELLGRSKVQKVGLVGVGHLGQAILSYFNGRMQDLPIVAAFDVSLEKSERVLSGCQCYHVSRLQDICKKESIEVAILAVPANSAQELANVLSDAGVKSIVNFAPVPLNVPGMFVENIDITLTIEKAAYFAQKL